METGIEKLLVKIAKCDLCKQHLPQDVYPVIRAHADATILIAGQAPGRVVYETGLPFFDKSGERLRDWLGVTQEQFYDQSNFAFLPMGLCFPGTGKSGDLPPRPECAPTWHQQVLQNLPNIKLTITIGQYAINYHLAERAKKTLTQTVQSWQDYAPEFIPLPHPSPRNNIWLAKNLWFEKDVVPFLQRQVAGLL